MNTFVRRTAQTVTRQRRNFSAESIKHEEWGPAADQHLHAHWGRWKQISMAAIVPVGALATYVAVRHFSHHDHHERVNYSHLRIRNKEYPWAENDCNLFDKECKVKWRSEH